jgi:hypothetical protein
LLNLCETNELEIVVESMLIVAEAQRHHGCTFSSFVCSEREAKEVWPGCLVNAIHSYTNLGHSFPNGSFGQNLPSVTWGTTKNGHVCYAVSEVCYVYGYRHNGKLIHQIISLNVHMCIWSVYFLSSEKICSECCCIIKLRLDNIHL